MLINSNLIFSSFRSFGDASHQDLYNIFHSLWVVFQKLSNVVFASQYVGADTHTHARVVRFNRHHKLNPSPYRDRSKCFTFFVVLRVGWKRGGARWVYLCVLSGRGGFLPIFAGAPIDTLWCHGRHWPWRERPGRSSRRRTAPTSIVHRIYPCGRSTKTLPP